jgi:hypothetical protein
MLQGDYLGMKLTIEDVDKENRHSLTIVPRATSGCKREEIGLLRYPPPRLVRGPEIGSMSG